MMAQIPSENLTIGKGQVFLAQHASLAPTAPAVGYRDVGNCPGVSFAVNAETVPHYSSRNGILVKDEEIVIETSRTGVLRIDDMSVENLTLFFLGDAQVLNVAAQTGLTETIPSSNVRRGCSYQLGVDPATRPSGHRRVSIDSVVRTSAPATAYAETAGGVRNWALDAERGFLTIDKASEIPDGVGLTVTYDVAAHRRQMILSGNAEKAFSMQYHAYNPKGESVDYFFPLVKIRPNGDLPLISEEYMEVEFRIEALSLGHLAPVYLSGQPETLPGQGSSGFPYVFPFSFG